MLVLSCLCEDAFTTYTLSIVSVCAMDTTLCKVFLVPRNPLMFQQLLLTLRTFLYVLSMFKCRTVNIIYVIMCYDLPTTFFRYLCCYLIVIVNGRTFLKRKFVS